MSVCIIDEVFDNPSSVAERFRDQEVLGSWVPWHILKCTKNQPDLKADISPKDVNKAYENAVSADTQGICTGSILAERSAKILEHSETDARLNQLLSPGSVYERFLSARRDGRLEEAAVRFESTENSPRTRKMFSPQDVALLMKQAVKVGNYDVANALLRMTDKCARFRDQISPELIALAFFKSLRNAERTHKINDCFDPLNILITTINDRRLRSLIPQDQVDSLSDLYKSFKYEGPFFSSDRGRAQYQLKLLKLAMIDPTDTKIIARRRNYYRRNPEDKPGRCLSILQRYPCASPT